MRHSPRLGLMLLGDKRGYVPRPLPWSSSRRPGEWWGVGGSASTCTGSPGVLPVRTVLSHRPFNNRSVMTELGVASLQGPPLRAPLTLPCGWRRVEV